METIDEVITTTNNNVPFQENGWRENFSAQFNFRVNNSSAEINQTK